MSETQHKERVEKIKCVITNFIQERLQAKLDKLKEGEEAKREELIADHQPETWIGDAARRVSQIQQVTHALKYSHPDARGSNLNSAGNLNAGRLRVGTHTLNNSTPDVVGNAAALDVNKFLRLGLDGKALLSLAVESSPVLQAAFSDNRELAQQWMASFANITAAPEAPASHKLAKQLYWPVGENEYHLLSPLFPSSLVHHLWSHIRTQGYREYPNMVVQKFGGTKPQNISQLNSERYGENYLLSSVPPTWKSDNKWLPLKAESIFDGWLTRRERVKELTTALREFLYRVQDYNNVYIRATRAEIVNYIIDETLVAAAELRDREECWTQTPDCKLNIDEQCWLNPYRCEYDEDFRKTYVWGDWKAAVCKRFANWLNATINDPKRPLPLGQDEAVHWQRDLDNALGLLRLEVDSHE